MTKEGESMRKSEEEFESKEEEEKEGEIDYSKNDQNQRKEI